MILCATRLSTSVLDVLFFVMLRLLSIAVVPKDAKPGHQRKNLTGTDKGTGNTIHEMRGVRAAH